MKIKAPTPTFRGRPLTPFARWGQYSLGPIFVIWRQYHHAQPHMWDAHFADVSAEGETAEAAILALPAALAAYHAEKIAEMADDRARLALIMETP